MDKTEVPCPLLVDKPTRKTTQQAIETTVMHGYCDRASIEHFRKLIMVTGIKHV